MKLLVFIDFTAFCAGKKKKLPTSPHRFAQSPMVRTAASKSQTHFFSAGRVTQEASMSMCNSFSKHAWEGSWRRMDWFGRIFGKFFELDDWESWFWIRKGFQHTLFWKHKVGFDGNSNLCWFTIVLWQLFAGGNWHRKNQPQINPICARKSWEERMNITVHWKKHTPTLALTAKLLRVIIGSHWSSNSIEFGNPHFAGGGIFNYQELPFT